MAFTTLPAAGAKLRASTLAALVGELRPIRAALSSNFALATGTTTLANVTGLSVSVAANTAYDGLTLLGASSLSNTPDVQYAMTWPTGSTVDIATGELQTGPTTFVGDIEMVWRVAHTSGAAICSAGVNTTLPTWTIMFFTITTGANAGTLQVQGAQNTSDATAVNVLARSKLILHQAT